MQSTALRHVEHLATAIGPRGSTTDGEARAAEYARDWFEHLGLEAAVETFRSPVSGWRPFALASLIGLACAVAFWFAGRGVAWALGGVMLLTTASVFAEMYFRPNLLKAMVSKGEGRNVVARAPAAGAAQRRILIAAHLDTHRTPWVFTSPGRLSFFKLMTTLAVVAFILSAITYLLFALTGWDWLRWLTLALAPVLLTAFAMTWQPDSTPFTQGANDNASGVGVLLSLAARLTADPLENTEVVLLATGCEEVGSVGAQAYLDRRRDQLSGLSAISIDNVGGRGAGVCYTSVEGMVFPLKPSPELFALAEELRAGQPDLNAYSMPYTTLHTDATCFMAGGVPSLSFVGLTPEGAIPDWHTAGDTFDKVDAIALENTEEFVWRLLRRFDAGASGTQPQSG